MLLSLLGYVRDVMGNQANSDVRPLIHPQAEMRLLVSLGRPLRGRARVVDALESGRSAVLFRAGDIAFEWLDMTSVLGFGHARYAREDSEIVERDVCWLCEFKDGLVWRVQAFDTEKAARQAYAGPRPAD